MNRTPSLKHEPTPNHMHELIQAKLKEIERTENVRILHAVESGSRAWGGA